MIAFVLGIILTIPFFIGLIIVGLLFDHNEKDGWSILMMAFIGFIAYNLFAISSTYILYAGIAYLPIGIIWSMWRWRMHGRRVVSKLENHVFYNKEQALEDIKLSNQVMKIVHWIVAWPLSIIASGLRDIITFLEILVTRHFRKLYEKLAQSSVNEINDYVERK